MTTPAYLIGQISVKDFPQYMDVYGRPTLALGPRFGAEFLVASAEGETLEGEWSGNWTVLVRFPSMEAARAFYDCPEYAPLRESRMTSLTSAGNLVLVGGYDPPPGGLA